MDKLRAAQSYSPFVLERFLGPMRAETRLGRTLNFVFWAGWQSGRRVLRLVRPLPAAVPAPMAAAPVIEAPKPVEPVRLPDMRTAERWYDDTAPDVSIIILNFNKAELTIKCLASLWEHTTGHSYEIIVVDNGSGAEDFAILAKHHGRSTLVRLEANRFFGEGNNIGFEASRGGFVIFMNNDVTVEPNWLAPLMQPFLAHPDCGVSGPKFVYPDGRLQEAGALLDKEGNAVQLGKFGSPDDPRFNEPRTVDYVSAATVAMRRETFRTVLGFDLMWEPAYYEDSDLCLKIRLLGLKTYYCPTSTVIHHENATSSDQRHGLKLNNIVAINRTKFIERWGDVLRGDAASPSSELFPASPANWTPKATKRAALYTPYNIIPGGGERYLLTIAEALRGAYEVFLVTPELFSRLRILTVGRELGLALDHVHTVSLAQAAAMPRFDLFVAMGNEIVPPVPAMGVKSIFHCQFPFPVSVHELARRWTWWDGYEQLAVNSPFTQRHVEQQMRDCGLPPRPVSVVYPPVDDLGIDEEQLSAKAPVILHVGRFFTGGHCKRQDLLIQTFRDHIHAAGIKAELHLVGSLHPEAEHRDYFLLCQELAKDLPVTFHLNASTTDMKALYRQASVYWHATGLEVDEQLNPEKAEHFGITIVEAMSAGCIPVVVNKGGPRHIVAHGATGYHFDTTKELADHTAAILSANNSAPTLAMRRAAIAAAKQFSKPAFSRFWQELDQSVALEPTN